MTWSGKLGFHQKPSKDIVVPIADIYRYTHKLALPQGLMGMQHYERGLQ
jgi:hypothetical protein